MSTLERHAYFMATDLCVCVASRARDARELAHHTNAQSAECEGLFWGWAIRDAMELVDRGASPAQVKELLR